MDIPHLRNKFKQKHTNENFVKINVKNKGQATKPLQIYLGSAIIYQMKVV